MKRRRQQGMSLVELIVAFTILLVLSTMAVPLARVRVRVEKERDLRAALREIHAAVDKYKDYCDSGYLGPAGFVFCFSRLINRPWPGSGRGRPE